MTSAARGRVARWYGGAVGVGFVLAMAAGADFPPPPGFIVVVMLGVALGAAVGRFLPGLLERWDRAGAGSALGRAAAIGLVASLAVWAGIWLLPGGGEPSVTVDTASLMVGFVMVGVAGMVGAVAVVAGGRLLDRVLARPRRAR